MPGHAQCAALLASVSLAAADAAAQDRQAPPADADAAFLTGGWGGERARLVAAGIGWRGDYVSESFANVRGGLESGKAYAQQLRLGVDFDMGLLTGWSGATLHFTINDRRGMGISSDYIGNRLPVQEVYGGLYTRLSEASVEQNLAAGRLNIRLGFFAMGNELGGMPIGCNLINAAFCAHPLSLSGNSGWYNYPNARWGASVRYKLAPELLLRTGVFQDNPRLGEESNAFHPFASGTAGVLVPLELEFDPGTASHGATLPGHYKAGVYYDTAQAARQGTPGTVSGRYGMYILADQVIVRDGSGGRGLSVFVQVTANPRASAQITRWYAAGLVKTGTFQDRDTDTFAVGVVHAQVNPNLRRAHAEANLTGTGDGDGYATLPAGETVVEVSYGWQPRRWLGVRADLQYIVEPGAFSYRSTLNAIAVGGQLRIAF